jgi:hypothetical protein
MNVTRSKSVNNLMSDIQIWEAKLDRYAMRQGKTLEVAMPEHMRRCTLMSLLPASMEKELKGHMDRYPGYANLRKRIEQDSFNGTTGTAPMIANTETAAPWESQAEDKNDDLQSLFLDALKYAKGKGKGRDKKPNPDKGKGKGKEKVCWKCGKTGHTQPECRSVKDKLQAPLGPNDKNRFRPQRLAHLEEQPDEVEEPEFVGSLEMSLMSCEEYCPQCVDDDSLDLFDLDDFERYGKMSADEFAKILEGDDEEFFECLEGETLELNMNEVFQPSENFHPFKISWETPAPSAHVPFQINWATEDADPDVNMVDVMGKAMKHFDHKIKDKLNQ